MKKFLAIFLVLTLLFSFAACDKNNGPDNDDETASGQNVEQTNDNDETQSKKPLPNEEKTTAPPFENPNITEPEALFKIIDINDYELKSSNPNTTATSGVTFIAKRYDVKNTVSNSISPNVTLDGAKIVLNETTVNDFIAQGWTISSKKDANTAVTAGDDQSAVLKNGNGEAVMVKTMNKSNIDLSLGECVITQVGINKDIEQENWADYTIDGKTNTASSTYADYMNAYGNPTSVNVVEYYQGNDYTHSKVTLNFENSVDGATMTLTVAFSDVGGVATSNSCVIEIE